jgi:hypothetical protein
MTDLSPASAWTESSGLPAGFSSPLSSVPSSLPSTPASFDQTAVVSLYLKPLARTNVIRHPRTMKTLARPSRNQLVAQNARGIAKSTTQVSQNSQSCKSSQKSSTSKSSQFSQPSQPSSQKPTMATKRMANLSHTDSPHCMPKSGSSCAKHCLGIRPTNQAHTSMMALLTEF